MAIVPCMSARQLRPAFASALIYIPPLTALCRPPLPPPFGAPAGAEDESRWFFQQLTVGMAYLHSIGVDNRELNLNNKLLTGDKTRPLLKINDFTYRWGRRACAPLGISWRGVCVWGGVGCGCVCVGGVRVGWGFWGEMRRQTSSAERTASSTSRRSTFGLLLRRAWRWAPPMRAPARPPCSPRTGCARALTPPPPARAPPSLLRSKSEQINSDPNSALGSLPYTAPEVLSNTMRHGHQADVWSLGVALYKMCVGRYPFERPEDAADARTAVQVRCDAGRQGVAGSSQVARRWAARRR